MYSLTETQLQQLLQMLGEMPAKFSYNAITLLASLPKKIETDSDYPKKTETEAKTEETEKGGHE